MSVLAILSLAGILAGANIPASPAWEKDYSHARQLAETNQKPIAVFVAAGDSGWQKLTREGGLSAEASKTLGQSYLCVYVNTDTAVGRKAAEQLGLSELSGMVISDRTGKLQAFRHNGPLSQTELATRLTKYADARHVVTTTESVAPAAPAFTPVNYAPAFGGCPNCQRGF